MYMYIYTLTLLNTTFVEEVQIFKKKISSYRTADTSILHYKDIELSGTWRNSLYFPWQRADILNTKEGGTSVNQGTLNT